MARVGLGGTVLEALPGKIRVVGIDRWDNDDWLVGDYDSPEEALEAAIKEQKENDFCNHEKCIGTHYFYDDKGSFLGGLYSGNYRND